MPSDDEAAVRAAHERWYVALNALFAGDPEPLSEVYSHADDVCYMPAQGGLRIGWENVHWDWELQSRLSRGGRIKEISSHIIVCGDMAMVMSVEECELQLGGGAETTEEVRETSVFRREHGEWKMVAHHADALAGWTMVAGAARGRY